MLRDIALEYFAVFSRKDLQSLQKMFDPNVSLRDWDVEAWGLKAVLAANANIFNAVETIDVEPVALLVDGHAVAAELLIRVNGAEPIKVVDILDFTPDNKIRAIRAYKG
jgi:hypothetical protein